MTRQSSDVAQLAGPHETAGARYCADGQQEQRSAQNLGARYQQLGTRMNALRSLDVGSTSADAVQARADAALVRGPAAGRVRGSVRHAHLQTAIRDQ